jgi:hypothetical protein
MEDGVGHRIDQLAEVRNFVAAARRYAIKKVADLAENEKSQRDATERRVG